MAEHQLPKLSVEGSIPFARSNDFKDLGAFGSDLHVARGCDMGFSKERPKVIRIYSELRPMTLRRLRRKTRSAA